MPSANKPPPPPNNGTRQDGPSANASSSRLTGLIKTDAESLVTPEDKLLVFRSLTGIDNVPILSTGNSRRTAPNVGIYTRVVNAERAAKRSFSFYRILINIFLGVQIIVAAALTALGAADGPHKAVTGFGAINTIVAGAMTYLKGSGLPSRLRHAQNEWKVVREYIEQRERAFCLSHCPLDVDHELEMVEHLYQKTKSELENHSSQGSFMINRSHPAPMLPMPTAPTGLTRRDAAAEPAGGAPTPERALSPGAQSEKSEPHR